MSLVLQSSGGGQITIQEPATASNFTQTLPAATGTVMVSGNMPTFSYYQTTTQSLSAATDTKLLFQTSTYDTTGGMFASSRFTPTVAGYYIFTSAWQAATVASDLRIALYKNGALFINITPSSTGTLNWVSGSGMAFCNGTTDYIEMYGYSALANTTNAVQQSTWFQGAMIRAA
jgi:hypothetical protein